MKTCILVHSQTGTTLRFAQVIADKLKEKGVSAELIRLQTEPPSTVGSAMMKKAFTFTNLPDVKKYDLLMVGGPTWAFTVSPLPVAAIRQLKDLHGKKLLPFVTMGFPFDFMGGRQGIAVMSRQAAAMGAEVLPGKVIPQLFRNFKKLMEVAADEIALSITKM